MPSTSTPSMRALTIWPEWAPTFLYLGKRIENRGWKPPISLIGQRFALHAGATVGGNSGRQVGLAWLRGAAKGAGWEVVVQDLRDGPSFFWSVGGQTSLQNMGRQPLALGAFVGTARLVGARPPGAADPLNWGMADSWHWLLDDVRRLPTPIPCVGRQRIWNVPAAMVDDLEDGTIPVAHVQAPWTGNAGRDFRAALGQYGAP